MEHMLGPEWTDLFDFIGVSASKPLFYTGTRPFRLVSTPISQLSSHFLCAVSVAVAVAVVVQVALAGVAVGVVDAAAVAVCLLVGGGDYEGPSTTVPTFLHKMRRKYPVYLVRVIGFVRFTRSNGCSLSKGFPARDSLYVECMRVVSTLLRA